jgi:two-component system, OmpR family, response regulator
MVDRRPAIRRDNTLRFEAIVGTAGDHLARSLPRRGTGGDLSAAPDAELGTPVRILVIEDDTTLARFVMKGLREAGFAVDHAGNGEDGLGLALSTPYDAAVVDIMLPKLDGLALIEELRRNKSTTPVIVLSAKRSVDDRIRGLHSGSDDYMTKPFAFAELVARIHALMRRASGAVEPTRLTVGELVVDLLARTVIRNGKRIELQTREFALLEYLMRNAGRPVSKTMILQHVWNFDFDPQTNIVEVLVSRLRTKVDADFADKMIHTVRGVGYVVRTV